MNIHVAKSWHQLNAWQLREIIDLYMNELEAGPEKTFQKMIFILFQKKNSFCARLRLRKIIKRVPMSELAQFGEFLLQPPNLHRFPVVRGVIAPADRLGDLSIKQFSFMDRFFHGWMQSKSDLSMRQLCASIYRTQEEFDELQMEKSAEFTELLSRKERQVIGFTYMCCYHHIADCFPKVYPKPQKKENTPATPPKPAVHTPFSEIIVSMAMNEESRPLGNLHECNRTRIYEFMNVFTKIIIKNEKALRDAK